MAIRCAILSSLLVVSGAAYSAAGDLDSTFGGSGVVNVGPVVAENPYHAAAWSKRNSIYSVVLGGGAGARVARVYHINEDGSPDASFGSSGAMTIPGFVADDANADITNDKRDRAVIAEVGTTSLRISRVTAAGAPDPSFNGGASLAITVADAPPLVRVRTQRDRRILVVTSERNTGTGTIDLAVRRVNENGTLDSTFGTGGVFRWQGPGPAPRTWGAGVGVQADGRIIVSGRYGTGAGRYTGYVLRLTAAGAIDSTFASGGVRSLVWVAGSVNSARDVAVMDDDRIVTGGGAYDVTTLIGPSVTARLTANGALDTTFGTGGQYTYPLPSYGGGWYSVNVASNGKVVLGGVKYEDADLNQSTGNFLRYRDNGVIDTSFAGDGSFEYAPTTYVTGPGGFLDNDDRPIGALVIGSDVSYANAQPVLVRAEAGKKSCP